MSFPGHAKSIEISRGPPVRPTAEHERSSQDSRKRVERQQSMVSKPLELQYDEPTTSTTIPRHSADDGILDDRGNRPSASLWIGNTSQGLRNSELRDVFAAFGPIVSANTKPSVRYAFVNFRYVDDALRAWKTLNGKPVFQNDQPLYIRFTTSESEAKQAKDAPLERKSSGIFGPGSAKRGRRMSGHDEPKTTTTDEKLPDVAWPNGPPPTGPKSHRMDISPPPLRRGDTYRPGESQDTSKPRARKSGKGRRRSRRDIKRWEPDVYRPSNVRRSCSRGSRSSVSSGSRDEYSSSLCSSPRSIREDSPYPWERPTKRDDPIAESLISTERSQNAKQKAKAIASRFAARTNSAAGDQDMYVESRTSNSAIDAQSDNPAAEATVKERERSYSPEFGTIIPEVPTQSTQRSDAWQVPAAVPQVPDTISFKLSLSMPNKRLRVEKDDTGSICSDVTSSSKSSLRKRKCTDCRKLGSDLSPLTPCTTCPRRFHSACGELRPSSCVDKATFVCGRCVREQTRAIQVESKAATNEQSQLASPALSDTDNDQSQFLLPTRNNELRIDTNTRNKTSFFQLHTPLASAVSSIDPLPRVSTTGRAATFTLDGAGEIRTSEPQTMNSRSWTFEERAYFYMQKYRVVTCQWWKRGHCRLNAEQCLYAHRETSISLPDAKKHDHSWTCWRWISSTNCPETEQSCPYAHKNTGLYLWSDDKVSTKHITCAWWINSDSCKWSSASCRYAHADTGVYSLDPADRRTTGSIISAERPVPASHVPKVDSKAQQSEDSFLLSFPGSDPEVYSTWYEAFGYYLGIEDGASATMVIDKSGDPAGQSLNDKVSMYADPRRGRMTTHPNRQKLILNQEDRSPVETPVGDIGIAPRSPVSFDHTSDISTFDSYPSREGLLVTSMDIQAEPTVDPRKKRLRAATGDVRGTAIGVILPEPPIMTADVAIPTETISLTPAEESVVSPTTLDPALSPINRRYHVCKGCKLKKIAFTDSLCLGCKKNTMQISVSNTTSTPVSQRKDVRHGVNAAGLASESEKQDLTDVLLLTCVDGIQQQAEHQQPVLTQPAVPRKRRTTGEDMFIPNKRSKPSLAFIQSGRKLVHTPRIQPSTYFSMSGQSDGSLRTHEARPEPMSLEQLTIAARLENAKLVAPSTNVVDEAEKRDRHNAAEVSRQVTAVEFASDNEETQTMGDHQLDHLFTSPLAVPRIDRDQVIVDDESESQYSTESSDAESESEPGDVPFSPSDELLVERRPEIRKPLWSQSTDQDDAGNQHQTTITHLNQSTEQSDSEQIPKATIRACRECNERHRRCTHKTIEFSNYNTPRTTAKTKKVDQTDTHATGEAKIAGKQFNAVGFSGQTLPYVCAVCRRHHKKCLHDNTGKYDGARCATYLAQKSSKSSDRSSAEWQAIQEAAHAYADDQSFGNAVSESTSTDSEDGRVTSSRTSIELFEDDLSKYNRVEEPLPPVTGSIEQGLNNFYNPCSLLKMDEDRCSPRHKPNGFTRGRRNAQFHLPHNERLREQGVMFESESDSDDYLDDDVVPATNHAISSDPLRPRPLRSRNLFDILPEHHPQYHATEATSRPPKISRKEEWKNLLKRQLYERKFMFGNPHRELERSKAEPLVRALVERVMPARDEAMSLMPTLQTREESVTFRDFMGLPRQPIACLMNDGATLAFRDAAKDNDRVGSMTSTRGFVGRVITDEDRLPVYDK